MLVESNLVALKEKNTPTLSKEIVAFLNTV
jgi:hypothetical protein